MKTKKYLRCDINKQWKKRWKNVVKYDHDWDYDFFLDLIIHKLELIKDSLLKLEYLDSDVKYEMLADVEHLLKLGEKIQNNEYHKSLDFLQNKSLWKVTLTYTIDNEERVLIVTQNGVNSASNKVFLDKNCTFFDGFLELDRLVKEMYASKTVTKKHYSIEDLWESEEDRLKYDTLIKEDEDDAEKDFQEFFMLLAKSMKSLWW